MGSLEISIANINEAESVALLCEISNFLNKNNTCETRSVLRYKFNPNGAGLMRDTSIESTPFSRYISSTTPNGNT